MSTIAFFRIVARRTTPNSFSAAALSSRPCLSLLTNQTITTFNHFAQPAKATSSLGHRYLFEEYHCPTLTTTSYKKFSTSNTNSENQQESSKTENTQQNNNDNNGAQQQQQQTQQQDQQQQQQQQELDPNVKKINELEEKIKKLETNYQNARLSLLTALADTENLRKNSAKDIQNAKNFGLQAFVKDLMEPFDNLSRALNNTPKENLESNELLSNLYQGVSLTRTELLKAFEKHGLKEYQPSCGEKFDPQLHMALLKVPDPSKVHGTVAFATRTGFMLNNRVIRAAQVGVFDNPSAPPPPSSSSSDEQKTVAEENKN